MSRDARGLTTRRRRRRKGAAVARGAGGRGGAPNDWRYFARPLLPSQVVLLRAAPRLVRSPSLGARFVARRCCVSAAHSCRPSPARCGASSGQRKMRPATHRARAPVIARCWLGGRGRATLTAVARRSPLQGLLLSGCVPVRACLRVVRRRCSSHLRRRQVPCYSVPRRPRGERALVSRSKNRRAAACAFSFPPPPSRIRCRTWSILSRRRVDLEALAVALC